MLRPLNSHPQACVTIRTSSCRPSRAAASCCSSPPKVSAATARPWPQAPWPSAAQVVLKAVRQDGCAVRHAFYQAFREDLEVMKEAKGMPRALSYRRRGRQAIENDWRSYQYASHELQGNKDLGAAARRLQAFACQPSSASSAAGRCCSSWTTSSTMTWTSSARLWPKRARPGVGAVLKAPKGAALRQRLPEGKAGAPEKGGGGWLRGAEMEPVTSEKTLLKSS